jgi:hypothetical protein
MKYLIFFGIVLTTEIVLAFLFSVVSQVVYKKVGLNFKSIFKGIIERTFLVIALMNDYPHALTFFSALKLGTRLKHSDANENGFNDFYLIGNLISVSVVFLYVFVFKNIL